MCGRFVAAAPPDELARYFAVDRVAESLHEPRYNVAPTDEVLAVFERKGERRLDVFHWGLVPFWAKDPSVGNKMINARVESLLTSNAFKRAFERRRCIVPADGFYEWKKVAGQRRKQPFYIRRRDREPLAFAGLWEVWRQDDRDDGDDALFSCTIVTGAANDLVAPIHDRMPVILPPATWDRWLDRELDDVGALQDVLVPVPSELLDAYPVGPAVSTVGNDGPALIEPAEAVDPVTADDAEQPSLF